MNCPICKCMMVLQGSKSGDAYVGSCDCTVCDLHFDARSDTMLGMVQELEALCAQVESDDA